MKKFFIFLTLFFFSFVFVTPILACTDSTNFTISSSGVFDETDFSGGSPNIDFGACTGSCPCSMSKSVWPPNGFLPYNLNTDLGNPADGNFCVTIEQSSNHSNCFNYHPISKTGGVWAGIPAGPSVSVTSPTSTPEDVYDLTDASVNQVFAYANITWPSGATETGLDVWYEISNGPSAPNGVGNDGDIFVPITASSGTFTIPFSSYGMWVYPSDAWVLHVQSTYVDSDGNLVHGGIEGTETGEFDMGGYPVSFNAVSVSNTTFCATLTNARDCHNAYCTWSPIQSKCVANSAPVANFLATCNTVDVAGWVTLPAIFDVPCQLKNAFTWVVSDDSSQIQNLVTQIQYDALNMWPIGYINRFVAILKTTTAVEPPAISYTLGSSTASTGLSGTYTFQIFDHTDTINSVTTDNGGKSIWDVFMPYWNVVVYLSLFVVILTTLMGSHIGHVLEGGHHNKNPHKQEAKKQ